MFQEKRRASLVGWMLVGTVWVLWLSCVPLRTRSPEDSIGPLGKPPTVEPEPRARPAKPVLEPAAAVTPAVGLTTGPLEIAVLDAILTSLENNRALRVERLNPPIMRTLEQEQRALFDPVLSGQFTETRVRSQRLARATTGTESMITETESADALLRTFLPTGTTVDLEGGLQRTKSSLYFFPFASMRGGVTVTQALLRGFGIGVNLATLRQARLDTLTSQYELRGFAEALVAQIEQTYWDYALAQRQIEIFENSLRLADQQLRETEERINVGKLAETELAATQAEVALRREGLINARSTLAQTRLQLLRLLNVQGTDPWDQEIVLRNQPMVPDVVMDEVGTHVKLALRMRPELNQARLAIQRGELEIIKTKNGLLPRLDFFGTLGKTGYASSMREAYNALDQDTYDTAYGFALEYPLGNRRPLALHKRAILSRDQAEQALNNLVQLVDVDVRSAYIEVNRAKEQVTATSATRQLQEETLRAETEKFRVGKSTTLLVAQAQRDLLASQISEVDAVVNYLKALVEFYRLEGSLLERRGIAAPGREPVNPFARPTWWK